VRRLPVILAAAFLAITLARVATYTSREMAAGPLGWIYSVGLGLSVYAAAYWTRHQTTRKAALVALGFFIAVDCLFNFSEVWLTASLDQPITVVGAVVYGLFPTLATALLGWLQTSIAKLPPTKSEARINGAFSGWLARLFAEPAQPAKPEPLQVAASEPEPKPARCICEVCGYGAKSTNALNGHKRKHSQASEPKPQKGIDQHATIAN
jgi:hypothetical protein